MNFEPLYRVAVESMPAGQPVSFWKSQIPNIINGIAALGALGAAIFTLLTQRTMVRAMEKEEALKTPVMEVKTVTWHKYPGHRLDDFYLSQVQLDLHNSIGEQLKELKYAILALDKSFMVISQFDTGHKKAGSNIGNQFPVFCVIANTMPNYQGNMAYFAIYTEAIDHRHRGSGKQVMYYSAFSTANSTHEVVVGEVIQLESIAIRIEEAVQNYRINEELDRDRHLFRYFPWA